MRREPVCAVFWADVEAWRDAVVICFARSLKAEMRNPNLDRQGKQKNRIFKSSHVFLSVSQIPDHGCTGFLVCIAFKMDCVVNIKREYISSFHKWTKKQRVNWSLCQRTHYYPAQPVEIQRLEKKKGTKILLSEEKEIGLGEINLPCTAVVILGPETWWSWNLSKLGQTVVRSTYLVKCASW